jgi:hypothetical protein
MCNSYSLTKGQAAIIALVHAMRDRTGNLPPMPGIFPDFLAPIARTASDGGLADLFMLAADKTAVPADPFRGPVVPFWDGTRIALWRALIPPRTWAAFHLAASFSSSIFISRLGAEFCAPVFARLRQLIPPLLPHGYLAWRRWSSAIEIA